MAYRKRNNIAIEIEEMLDTTEAVMTMECCIYKVPHQIRKLNEDAYTPKVVSIGPFHHRNPILQKMESQKQVYLKRFLQRTETNLDSLVSCVEESEQRVRCCYSEDIDFFKEDFVKMILLDAGFILQLFCQVYKWERTIDYDLPLKQWLMTNIIMDLYLLENQLPFFILNELYNLTFPDPKTCKLPITFLHLTFDVLATDNNQKLCPESITICHFTDLLRTFHLQPSVRRSLREAKIPKHIYTITQLREAGVKFKVNERSKCLLDLEFSEFVLKIPHLQVEDSTKIQFRNIMALEQCHYPDEQYFTDYIVVLDHLVNKESDVKVLVRMGIFRNMLGDNKAMARLVNGLRKNITFSDFNQRYHVICKDLNAFYEDPCHTMMTTLKRDYCKTPWQTATSFAAILILSFTFIQTICSIFQIVK